MIDERCIDGSPHVFVFLRQETKEPTWHNFVTEDVFFCQKCLTTKSVEVPKKEARRW
jgi:hypothetical protein